MLEAVRILATEATKYSFEQLEGMNRVFGVARLVPCSIPVGVLVNAHREYENLKRPEDSVTSCARVVVAAEAFLEAWDNDPPEEPKIREWHGPLLALTREVDNLWGQRRVPKQKPVKKEKKVKLDKITLSSVKDRIISDCVDILRSNRGRTAATEAGQKPG
jgi:hypothetical protein